MVNNLGDEHSCTHVPLKAVGLVVTTFQHLEIYAKKKRIIFRANKSEKVLATTWQYYPITSHGMEMEFVIHMCTWKRPLVLQPLASALVCWEWKIGNMWMTDNSVVQQLRLFTQSRRLSEMSFSTLMKSRKHVSHSPMDLESTRLHTWYVYTSLIPSLSPRRGEGRAWERGYVYTFTQTKYLTCNIF